MRRNELTEDDLINKWLGDYHNTSIKQVIEENPEWIENPDEYTPVFYAKYAVTQEQHDEWHNWMIKALAKHFGVSQKSIRMSSWAVYLNTAPNVKQP